MFRQFVNAVLSNTSSAGRSAVKSSDRNLRLERLEDRAMLSVAPFGCDVIPEPEFAEVPLTANVEPETIGETPVTVDFDDSPVGLDDDGGEAIVDPYAAPSDLVFGEYDASTQTTSLSWIDNSTCETGFRVEYSTDGGNTWTFSQTKDADVSTCDVYGVQSNSQYQFRVCALFGGEKSDWTYSETLYTTSTFEAPDGFLLGKYDATTRSLVMSWLDNSNSETGFRVEYSTDGGDSWLYSQTTGVNNTVCTAWGVKPNETYQFRVCALRGSERTDWAYSDSLETTPELEAPSDLVLGEYDAETRSVTMSWTDNANVETGFLVEYSTNGGKTWRYSQTVGANVTTRTAWGVKPNAEYMFRVCAFRGAEKTNWTYSDPLPTGKLVAPSDMTLGEYDAASQTVTMSWKDNCDVETGFRVEYSIDGGQTWRRSEVTDANVTSRTAWSVRPNATYNFRVCALLYGESSDWAYSETLDTSAKIPAPSELILGKYDAETETLPMSWTNNSGEETGFRVEYTLDGLTWHLSEKMDAGVVSRTAWNVHQNQAYQFRVCALQGEQRTAWTYSRTLPTVEENTQNDVQEDALDEVYENFDETLLDVEF